MTSQDGETANAYTAFTTYRDLGAIRSIEKTVGKFYTPDSPHKYHPNRGLVANRTLKI
jgi:hypothetical protein